MSQPSMNLMARSSRLSVLQKSVHRSLQADHWGPTPSCAAISLSERSSVRSHSSLARERTDVTNNGSDSLPPHSLLPAKMLARSLLVSTISSNRLLLPTMLRILDFLSTTKIRLLSVEHNFLIRKLLKKTFYEHFCAGENGQEVRATIKNIKDMGFEGVILTYAREIVVDANAKEETGSGLKQAASPTHNADIESWRVGVMDTVEMVGEGDILALKFTGAGQEVSAALTAGKKLPTQMTGALSQICDQAFKKRVRIFIDAEQQSVQHGINQIALDLMRKYNVGRATVYNTYQAYLRDTPATVAAHMSQASEEGFTLGAKLVRGAYMKSEPRHLIHHNKQNTDDCYDNLAHAILQKRPEAFWKDQYPTKPFPSVELFLATHNKNSAMSANDVQNSRAQSGASLVPLSYGQLLGMADEVSCSLLQLRSKNGSNHAPPSVYKCLSWGSLSDCISYLLRRAVENRDAVGRTVAERNGLRREVFRRLKTVLGGNK